MTGEQFVQFHRDTFEKLNAICKAKNADYAGGNGGKDAFANFRLVSQFGAASVEQGFFTRMTDKMSRISTFIQKGVLEVKDESIDDTLLDLANYSILFLGFLRDERVKKIANGAEAIGWNVKEPAKREEHQVMNLPNHGAPERGGLSNPKSPGMDFGNHSNDEDERPAKKSTRYKIHGSGVPKPKRRVG